jgi:hypothetical protein
MAEWRVTKISLRFVTSISRFFALKETMRKMYRMYRIMQQLNGMPLQNDKWQEEKVVLLCAEISVWCGRVTSHTAAYSLSKPLLTSSPVTVQRQFRNPLKVRRKSWEFIAVVSKCSHMNCAVWVITQPVVVNSYRNFGTNYRSHLLG